MSGYDPQRRRRLTTRANTTAVEALLDGEPSRPRAPRADTAANAAPDDQPPDDQPTAEPLEARSGCLSALLTLGRR